MEKSLGYGFEYYMDLIPGMKQADPKASSSIVLAYIGDCVFDLIIKMRVVGRGGRQVHKLHEETSRYVQASAQSFMMRAIQEHLTEEERQKYLYRFLTGNTIGLTEQNFRLGDNMYADVNNDGKLDQNDIVYLGTDDPKISFSFNVGAEWKGFDLSLVFQGAAKRTIFRNGDNNGNEIWRIPMKALYLNTSNQSVGNTWSPENRGAYYPTYSNKNEINDYNYQASSWSVEDGSYIRLKNVTLGYNVPSAFLAKTKAISSCRVYVAGADLWEYSKINDGWDPEASRKVSAAGRFPFVRTVTFGLNLTF